MKQEQQIDDIRVFVGIVQSDDWRMLCAAPLFLERTGSPRDLQAIRSFPAITFGNPPLTDARFLCGKKAETIEFRPGFYASSGDVAHAAALAGAGIILKSVWDVGEDIRSGALEHLFPEWPLPSRPIYAVFPANRFRTARIKSFIRFLTEKLTGGRLALLGPEAMKNHAYPST